MSNSNLSLERLKSHLFETLEGVKNLSDPHASDNEKINIEQAKSIVEISGKIIDIYKTQLDGMNVLSKVTNYKNAASIMVQAGIVDDQSVKALEQ